jgi:ABC-type transport system involved in multi-copper enzyme maturation permease subunit
VCAGGYRGLHDKASGEATGVMISMGNTMDLRTLTKIIAFEKRRFFKNPLAVLFSIFFLLYIIFITFRIGNSVDAINAAFVTPKEPNLGFMLAQWVVKNLPESAQVYLRDESPVLAVFYLLIIHMIPLFAMILSCDQLASDISRKHLRFLLLKVTRVELFVGRFISNVLMFWIITIPQLLIASSILTHLDPATSFDTAIGINIRILVSIMIYVIPFIAVMSFAGVVTAQPFLSLLLGIGYWFVIGLLSSLFPLFKKDYEYVQYFFPTAVKYSILSNNMGDLGLGIGLLILYTAIFFGFGLLIFSQRDI